MKKVNIKLLSIIAAGGLLSQPIFAADIAAGKAKSVTCAACHGNNGISMIPMYPNLAGQKEQYLVDKLQHLLYLKNQLNFHLRHCQY